MRLAFRFRPVEELVYADLSYEPANDNQPSRSVKRSIDVKAIMSSVLVLNLILLLIQLAVMLS